MPTPEVRSSAAAGAKTAVQLSDSEFFITDRSAVMGRAVAAAAAAAVAGDYSTPSVIATFSNRGRSSNLMQELSRDAAIWLEYADQDDGTLDITVAPLWFGENPLERDWHALRQKLRDADTASERGAD